MKLRFIIFILVGIFLLGYILGGFLDLKKNPIELKEDITIESNYSKKYDGIRIGSKNYFEVKNISKKYDEDGDWICVNVKDMSYERCREVVNHECAHELYAEVCEHNTELCRKTQELLNNYTQGGKK
ncbi:MAG: hypothetical protein ACTSQA_04460 [Candidatus Heimdallarchaeaceae archaeon]